MEISKILVVNIGWLRVSPNAEYSDEVTKIIQPDDPDAWYSCFINNNLRRVINPKYVIMVDYV